MGETFTIEQESMVSGPHGAGDQYLLVIQKKHAAYVEEHKLNKRKLKITITFNELE